jgi:hypothetical protein
MENVDLRPEAIKLNVSADEVLEKTFVFELKDTEVKLDFKISESDINKCLSGDEVEKLYELYPEFYDKYQFNEFYLEEAKEKYPNYFNVAEDGTTLIDENLRNIEPKYYLENQIKKEYIKELPNIIIGSIVEKAIDKKSNSKQLAKLGNSAKLMIVDHIINDEDVANFFITCGVFTEIR